MTTYTGDGGDNTFTGGSDDDFAAGEGGNDTLNGLGGADKLQGGDGNDILDGGDGDDFLYGGTQFAENFPVDNDILYGGAGTDFLYGGNGDDILNGGADNDVLLEGQGGNNTLNGDDGNDQIEVGNQGGNNFVNTLNGGAGNDSLTANGTSGTMSGGTGNDILNARSGTFSLDGGADNDQLLLGWVVPNDGIQTATGGTGADEFMVFHISRFDARDRILDFNAAAGDRLAIGDNNNGRTGTYWAATGKAIVWGGALDPSLFVVGAALPPGNYTTGFVQLWYVQTGGNTYLIADSDADLVLDVTDMVVELTGTLTLDMFSFASGTFGAITGTAAADTIAGGSGNDDIYGLGGNDVLSGGPGGFDALYGGDGDDTLDTSGSQHGYLNGEAGNDTLTGSIWGDDVYGGTGADLLNGANGDDLMFGEADNDNLRGDSGADRLFGGGGNDLLEGGVSDDSMDGETGDDVLRGGEGSDNLRGGDGNDTVDYSDIGGAVTVSLADNGFQNTGAGGFDLISADVENLTGSAFGDTLTGNGGANIIDGGGGADAMTGGAGNDVYVVDNALDSVIELAGQGVDEIRTSLASYSLAGTQIENLTGIGTVDQMLTGNAGANSINGGAGNDSLFGGGNDVLSGGLGNDTFFVAGAGDTVAEAAGEGHDVVYAAADYALGAGQSIDVLSAGNHAATTPLNLTGNALGQEIWGNAGANNLRGGGGTDYLVGQGGNDTYFVDTAAALVFENAGAGNDVVYASVSYTLLAGQSVEVLSAGNHAATTPLSLTGNELGQEVWGNAGANNLRGGGGTDYLVGQGGDDTYFVDTASALVFESAGNGRDVVYTSVSYTLLAGQSVEVLSASVHAATTALDLIGNELGQEIWGNAGANNLRGGGGTDYLLGQGGNDTYFVDVAAVQVYENAGAGNDIVYASVSYALLAGQSVDALSTGNHAATTALDMTGNELIQELWGNAGANILDGKLGNDALIGQGGADTFAFTTALSASNVDFIADFVAGTDRIALDDAIFTGLTPGALSASAFVIGTSAQDADDRIIYNSATGQLYFDADGNGAGAAIQFATLSGHPVIAASDFTVI